MAGVVGFQLDEMGNDAVLPFLWRRRDGNLFQDETTCFQIHRTILDARFLHEKPDVESECLRGAAPASEEVLGGG